MFAACYGLCFVRHCCLWPAVLYICLNYLFLIPLQENIDTVTADGVESVGEEDSFTIKTEQHCIELVRTVKSELEVSGLWWCGCDFLQVCVYMCVV
jgi:hypothetical protein